MGRCQGNFCGLRIANILARELAQSFDGITKKGRGSEYLFDNLYKPEPNSL
jgi:hypothetical protein